MTEIEERARDMVLKEDGDFLNYDAAFAVLCRAIESHEAFRQEVSDALYTYFGEDNVAGNGVLTPFFNPTPKPDPLVEVLKDFGGLMPDADDFRALLEARGLEIRSKNDD